MLFLCVTFSDFFLPLKLCSPLPINFKLLLSKYYLQFFFAKIKHAHTLKTSCNTVHPTPAAQNDTFYSLKMQYLQFTVFTDNSFSTQSATVLWHIYTAIL